VACPLGKYAAATLSVSNSEGIRSPANRGWRAWLAAWAAGAGLPRRALGSDVRQRARRRRSPAPTAARTAPRPARWRRWPAGPPGPRAGP
jgi:hypothetical protein